MSTALGKTGEVPVNGASPEKERWTPLIVAFCCNWCSYAGGDLAGTSRMDYPANVKVIRMPCSSRINPLFILRAFQRGADGVLVAGCHPGDCHYTSGNYYVRRNLSLFRRLLEFSGIEPERFQVSWISASEGDKFAGVMQSLTEEIKALGPNGKWRDSRWQSVE
ncbi:MAG: hydrogenase iron-sulfur subunit [Firmicutes bacterium]|nr:hydrogenase iron-sulfur subunit [Bacillota bacterium]